MQLTTELSGAVRIMTFDQVRTALSCLHENGNSFAVLERDDGCFIQTAISDGHMVVEKQEGGLDRHFRATRNGSTEFAFADVERIFAAFYNRSPPPPGVAWEPMALKPTPEMVVRLLKFLPWAAGLGLLFYLARDAGRIWELME